MIGILTFSSGLLCQKEVLGTSYNAKIGGLEVCITFPSLNNSTGNNKVGYLNPLLPPNNAKNYRRGDEFLFWGCPLDAPDFNSVVQMITLEHNCPDDNVLENAQLLYKNMRKWENDLFKYCYLCTKEYLAINQNTTQGSLLDILSDGKHIPTSQPIRLTGHIRSRDSFATKDVISDAINFASNEKDLFLEYQMLLSSYIAIQKNKKRQAIIDGSAAVELCLVKVITEYCEKKYIEPKILLDKYRTLGDRFALVKKIDKSLPTLNYDQLIISPRNDVAHIRQVDISINTIRKFISTVEKVLEHYHTSYY